MQDNARKRVRGSREACMCVRQGMDSVLGRAFVRGSGNAPTSSERRSEDVVGQARRPAHRGAAPRCLQSQTEGRDLVREAKCMRGRPHNGARMMARGAASRRGCRRRSGMRDTILDGGRGGLEVCLRGEGRRPKEARTADLRRRALGSNLGRRRGHVLCNAPCGGWS